MFVSHPFAISHRSAQDDIQNDVKGRPSVVYNVDVAPYGLKRGYYVAVRFAPPTGFNFIYICF